MTLIVLAVVFQVNKQSQFEQSMLLRYCLKPHKDNKPKVKVAMFSQLINPKDIEVPLIMKGNYYVFKEAIMTRKSFQ